MNVAGVGVLAGRREHARGADFARSCSPRRRSATSPRSVKEYPLVAGVEADPSLVPLAQIQQPDVDLADLDDLRAR